MEFKDKIKNININKPYKTMFLTLNEQAQLKNKFKDSVRFEGGFINSERKRAYINIDDNDITCLLISYNKNFLTLTHQNIMGSLLSLNVKREVLGDIVPESNVLFVISELKDFFIQEFNSIGNHSITLQEVDGSTIVKHQQIEDNIMYVDSLRLDLIVSRITKKSRNETQLMIENDLVQVNHLVTNKYTKECSNEDILSIRKFGRFKLLDTTKTSKKGKIVLKYGKYV